MNHSVCIVGAGLAGLATAIKLKLDQSELDITVLDKKNKESNTCLAGMRFCTRKANQGTKPANELVSLLAAKKHGKTSPQIDHFVKTMLREQEFWQALIKSQGGLAVEDKPEWFGPRWGRGKGGKVIKWLTDLAESIGVDFATDMENVKLQKEGTRINGIIIKDNRGNYFRVEANLFVLAGGSIGGRLFHSTNKDIHNPPAQLAYEASIPLVGSTTKIKRHPFGQWSPTNGQGLGCYPTDELAGARIFLGNGFEDHQIEDWLKQHEAHYHFSEICERVIAGKSPQRGALVRIEGTNGQTLWARVSHHYSPLGILTEADGIRVKNMENLCVVGDAGGWQMIDYLPREAGFGLAKCLTDAEFTRANIGRMLSPCQPKALSINAHHPLELPIEDPEACQALKDINTHYLVHEEGAPQKWLSALQASDVETNSLGQISLQMARANLLLDEGEITGEPIVLTRE